MKRSPVRRALDRRIFRRSASRSKSINVRPVMMRGGIRL